jgi:hypothetical protein
MSSPVKSIIRYASGCRQASALGTVRGEPPIMSLVSLMVLLSNKRISTILNLPLLLIVFPNRPTRNNIHPLFVYAGSFQMKVLDDKGEDAGQPFDALFPTLYLIAKKK